MDIIQQLQTSKEATLPYFDLSTDDLSRTYAPGKWTIREILVHICDAEAVLSERVKRAIAEPKPVVWGFDQDLWCKNFDYANYPLELVKGLYLANRQIAIYLATQFYESAGANPFIHSETGLRTVKDELDKIAWHNSHHLTQIKQALKVKQ